ncbi:MAG: LysR family transcriptional regulator [Oleispira antarctica]|uniref:Transcriptional regulator, LysR family n=1 Tax=Oleispira antarctica RB-8 TaxID=698738 RepID=R4YS47_OLEAN|nr:LysR family transcriptional regulator [Oleispira antarctica]MBQ0792631.1 LysR family transcriptional regulator [Oleispira antarctica]CCK74924.1 Transcriptional regulator, LysR family [Oleispira antarctica RB-8]
MDELKRMGVFTRVVETKSFSEAARQLGIAKSAVSKQIAQLEKEVGVRLLNRTTRSLSLTEAGEILYRHSAEIVNRTKVALSELREYQNQPTGTLRIASPVSYGTQHLVPVIKEIRAIYPLLKIDLLLEDRIINMVDEGVDLAIRIGWLQESNLVAKKICETPVIVFASPEYLAQKGIPKTPQDLQQHDWISLSLLSSPLKWQFKKKGKEYSVQVHSHLKSNSVAAVIALAKSGQGISALSKFAMQDDMERGLLQPLLTDYELEPTGIYAVYPHREHVPPKVRIFIDFLSNHCHNAAWAN